MAWYSQFPANSGIGGDQMTIALVAGRGGAKLIDAANRANLLGAPLIVCVNEYTDGSFDNSQAATWIFSTATAYLNAMKPYRDAIKAVDPNAIVAVFVTDANAGKDAWSTTVAAYPNKYWDAITYHHYPP